jgi:hypothetical protein
MSAVDDRLGHFVRAAAADVEPAEAANTGSEMSPGRAAGRGRAGMATATITSSLSDWARS